ncbi:MAG: hypothetical protein RIT19_876 [Verrucomicrobiota bacterium]|jgi:formylglycine-generating enzyme required for sulfatase activity
MPSAHGFLRRAAAFGVSGLLGFADTPPASQGAVPIATPATEVAAQKAWKDPKALQVGTAVSVTLNDQRWIVRWVPAGRFVMGSPADEALRDKDEIPHEVILSRGFFMAETECTQAQWEAVMGRNPSHGKAPDQPVNQVAWKEAQEYCRRLTEMHRTRGIIPEGWEWDLPTEAQWEYACRAGTTGAFAGNLGDIAWIESNSDGRTHPVKTRQPNAWGLHDLHGNVWEWCRDWYGDYPTNTVHDPTGPSAGTFRCYRGGSRIYGARRARSAIRGAMTPELRGDYLGFRAVLLPRP